MNVSKAAAEAYLTSLISKTLRITTSDTRLFVGEFKCTDAERNIILSRTYEYRLPPPPTISPLPDPTHPSSPRNGGEGEDRKTVTQDIPSRYLGLVVIPGPYITKIEVEEFASQVRGGAGSKYAMPLPVEEIPGNV